MEHILNLVSIAHYTSNCFNNTDPTEQFFKSQLSQLFTYTSYSPWKAFIGKIVNIVATFAWSYMDLFVMVISLGLSTRFKQLNDELEQVKGEVNSLKISLDFTIFDISKLFNVAYD